MANIKSQFLELPVEMRYMMYEQYFSDQVIKFITTDKTRLSEQQSLNWGGEKIDFTILATSKQVNDEAIKVAHEKITFRFFVQTAGPADVLEAIPMHWKPKNMRNVEIHIMGDQSNDQKRNAELMANTRRLVEAADQFKNVVSLTIVLQWFEAPDTVAQEFMQVFKDLKCDEKKIQVCGMGGSRVLQWKDGEFVMEE